MRTVQTLRRSAAKDGDDRTGSSRRVRHEARTERRRRAGVPGAEADASSSASNWAPRPRSSARPKRTCSKRLFSSSTSRASRRRKSTCRSSRTITRRSRPGCRIGAGRKVRIVVPQRGEKRGLVDLATRNAGSRTRRGSIRSAAAQYDALNTLQTVLALSAMPRRIECFDISTIQGSETVASMVVCEDGRMRKADYRKFRIRGLKPTRAQADVPRLESPTSNLHAPSVPQPPTSGPRPPVPDDFAAMHEVVRRRYRKLLEDGGPFPDLILIDGGKGQLTAAYAALEALGLANLVAVGHCEEGRAPLHARSNRADRAGGERSGAVAAAAYSRRGASLRRDLSSQGALDARPARRRSITCRAMGGGDGVCC